ncbi:MAG: hypothetical protein R3F58_10580 [Steroidobacteraceae bacterium]
MARTLLLALLVSAATKASAAQPEKVDGWVEAVAIVRQLERSEQFFLETAGYERRHTGPLSPQLIRFWRLPVGATGRMSLLAEPGANRGYIRLVELANAGAQMEIRSAGQFFDTGGIMGLNVRVRDIDVAFARLQSAGWRPYAQPVRFAVEEYSVAEAIFQGPDSLVVGLIEREEPALGPEWTMGVNALSRPNNAFATTSDLEADLRFYEQHFGWRRVLTDKGPAAKAGPNLYGWPHNFVADVQREVVWVHPRAAAEGSVAMIQLRGADGRDFSDRAGPPNFGWVSLRTWSDGKLARKSVADRRQTSAPVNLFPYGCVVIKLATSPSGVSVEQLTAAKGCP